MGNPGEGVNTWHMSVMLKIKPVDGWTIVRPRKLSLAFPGVSGICANFRWECRCTYRGGHFLGIHTERMLQDLMVRLQLDGHGSFKIFTAVLRLSDGELR